MLTTVAGASISLFRRIKTQRCQLDRDVVSSLRISDSRVELNAPRFIRRAETPPLPVRFCSNRTSCPHFRLLISLVWCPLPSSWGSTDHFTDLTRPRNAGKPLFAPSKPQLWIPHMVVISNFCLFSIDRGLQISYNNNNNDKKKPPGEAPTFSKDPAVFLEICCC